MEINKNRKYVILPSKDKYMHARVQGGVYYYYLPQEQYEKYKEKNEILDNRKIIETEEKRSRLEFERETDKIIDIMDISRHRRNNNVIELYETRPDQRREVSPKRNIKSAPSKAKRKKYKANRRDHIRASVAAALIAIGIAAGVCGIEKQIDYSNRYNETAATVETMSTEEIRDSIDEIIKQEISDATGTKIEDINISQYSIGSSLERTEVDAGEKTYTYDNDLRSPINIGNTLSNELKNVINAANAAKDDRKALIKALMKARKFSEEKDLVVDGEKLKDVKTPEIDDEER